MIFQWPRIKFRFGLRGLLVGVTLLAIPLAAAGNRWRHAVRQEKFVYDVLAAAGRVQYDDGWDPREEVGRAQMDEHCVTFFAIDMIGADALRERNFWHDVVAVELGPVSPDDEHRLRPALEQITNFSAIRSIKLRALGITADEIAGLVGLRRLSELEIEDGAIDEALIESLRRLPALKSLVVFHRPPGSRQETGPRLADLSEQLSRALPDTHVHFNSSKPSPTTSDSGNALP